MNKRIVRVLVVDDFAPWHQFVSSILQTQPEVRIIGNASDGSEAVEKARDMQPDLILSDVSMPVLNGLQAARQILTASPQSKILFVSEYRLPEIAEEAINIGARGFVLKTNASTELLSAVHAVLEGNRFVSAGIGYDPSKTRHQFTRFPNDESLVEGFASFIEETLRNGGAAMVLATESHHAGILQKLTSNGVDVKAAVREKRYFSAETPESPTLELANYFAEGLARTGQETRLRIGVG